MAIPNEPVAGAPAAEAPKINTSVPTAEDKDKRKAANAALKELMKPVKIQLMIGRILGGLSGILAVAPYIALVWLGDIVFAAHKAGQLPDYDAVMDTVMFLIGAFFLQIMVYVVGLTVTHFADSTLTAHIRQLLVEKLSHAPLAWFSSTTSGRVRKAIQDDTATLHVLVAHAPVDNAAAIITPLALLIYAASIDWRLALLTVATIPLYIGFQAVQTKDMGAKTTIMDEHLANVSSTAVEFADGVVIVKAFGRTGEAHNRYQTAYKNFIRFYLDWVGPLLKVSATSASFIAVPLLLLINLSVGGLMVSHGIVTIPQVIVTSLISLVIPSSIDKILMITWSYQRAGNAAYRILETFDTPVLSDAGNIDQTLETYDVEYRDVTFKYDETAATPTLDKINLRLPQGTVTALVGPSGSGKSTLATMLARFQDPDTGTITIGGVPITQMRTQMLYRNVSFVLQDPQLVRTSIRDNVKLARPEATDQQIWDALTDAQIADDIRALDKGLDTIYGTDVQLSGGQAQRLAIARALLADTPVLILDEATASTDPDSEAEIQRALSRLAVGRTVLVIAHRPNAIIGCDQVAIIEDGKLAALGTPEQVANHPHMQKLFAPQEAK
ncbi:ABC transporter ATP-binding protein [Boudabousia marimammalium]|uniref:Iron ABC transporter ATP-binding protein n=1 Tax=Boudabousia marimammalium TaxID=156892 RepID=A0A1Q5PS90_9ACTO|nr:ABC transporter ATP-binding protein [Boudabousia marimammalium]OKL50426.1 hypothetical protein BM477_00145 [Boudabousia marimammalium]